MQVQRLIAVLSVPSIGRSALLQDAALRLPEELPKQDMAVLRQAGWTEENGLRALLNFSGAAQYWTDHQGFCMQSRKVPAWVLVLYMQAQQHIRGASHMWFADAGERVLHYKDTGAAATDGEAWERYRKQLRQILSQGRAEGRVYKPSSHRP